MPYARAFPRYSRIHFSDWGYLMISSFQHKGNVSLVYSPNIFTIIFSTHSFLPAGRSCRKSCSGILPYFRTKTSLPSKTRCHERKFPGKFQKIGPLQKGRSSSSSNEITFAAEGSLGKTVVFQSGLKSSIK